jgi:hypothetical protein
MVGIFGFCNKAGGAGIMKLRLFRVLAVFLLLSAGAASASAAEVIGNFIDKINPFEKLALSGYFKNETSVGLRGTTKEFMKINDIADLKANYVFNDSIEFFAELKTWYDSAYDAEGRFRDVSHKEKNIKLRMPIKTEWLRECYFDVYTPKLDLRLGKQQVVWGTTDGVRILDMVNPLDYREWTLQPYSESRIPLWMLKAETELAMNSYLQLLLIPDYEPNYYAPAGSPISLRTVVIGAESAANPFVNVTTIDERPERKLENTKIGLRWRNVVEAGLLSGLEYTLNYLHTYDFASSSYTRVTYGFPVQIELTRRAEQVDVLGFSFAKSITKGIIGDFAKGWTVRGEFAYIKNGAMNYGTDREIIGTVDVDQYNYALGFDKNLVDNWAISCQFIQLIADSKDKFRSNDNYTLLSGPTRGPLDKTETMATFKISTSFMYERLKPELLILYGDDNDWRLSPKIEFEANDNLSFAAGFHFFEGKETQLNGQFDDNDQFFLETKYSW